MNTKVSNSQQIFAGVKVLAVARVIAAPFCALQFALNGAEVLTIEDPKVGDSQRYSEYVKAFMGQGMGLGFLTYNLNKRSMRLALNTPDGQEIFRQLARDADVVIENLRTGTMARYGIGYEELRKINPGIIFCSITGYGQTGPKARDPGIDDAIQAASGMMSVTGTPETGPLKTGTTVVDYTSGYVSAFAIASALFHRSRTGQGQAIDIAMMEVAMNMIGAEVARAATSGEAPALAGNASNRGRYISNSYRCKEGRLMIAARADNLRQRFYEAIGRTDIPQDPRFATPEACRRNLKELDAEVEKTLLTRTAQEWETYLNEKAVPAMRVLGILESVKHPHIEARGFLKRIPADPAAGVPAHIVPGNAYRFSVSPTVVEKRAPLHGEHTDEVLAQLGMSEGEIAELRGKQVI